MTSADRPEWTVPARSAGPEATVRLSCRNASEAPTVLQFQRARAKNRAGRGRNSVQ